MRRTIFATTVLPLLCLAVPAFAQETGQAPAAETEALDRMAQSLSDPARQAQLAATLAAVTEIVLDIPLAPLVGPLAEAAGEPVGSIDPDLTLRRMAPRSENLSRDIQDNLPRAMDRMAGLSGSLAALVPALRDMADQLEIALPPEDYPPTP